jgi:hypothetical protein
MLSLSELAKIHKKKLKSKTKTYEIILDKCHTQIKNMANRDQTFCYYSVPLYVLGLPLYDINSCLVYILLHLKKRGFNVQMTDSQTIYISWKHIYEKQNKHKEPIKKIQDWKQKNQQLLPQRQITTFQKEPSSKIHRLIERSKFLL